MKKVLSNKLAITLFVLPGILLFLFIFVYPIIYTMDLGFTSWRGVGEKEYVLFDNYIQLFTKDSTFRRAISNTLIILVVATIGQLVPALFFALLLGNVKCNTRFFRVAFFIPVLLSSTAIALMWQEIYDINHGLLNEALRLLGLTKLQHEWLTEEATCLIAVIVPVIWQWIGYHMVILYAGLKGIPAQYVEAAKLDGANSLQATTKIILPMMRDVIKICVVLAVVGSIKIFDNVYVMTGGGPYNLTITIAIHMYKEAFLKLNYGYGSAIAVVLCILCIGVYLLINKLMTREPLEY